MMHFPQFVVEDLTDMLRFLNPDKIKMQRLYEKTKNRQMRYALEHMEDHIDQVVMQLYMGEQAYMIPIGHLDTVKTYLEECEVEYETIDQRINGKKVDMPCEFRKDITLRDYQEEAVEAMMRADRGLVVIPARGGKTLTASNFISKAGVKTLWICHRADLFRQTKDALERDTGRQWYRIGDGRCEFHMGGDYFIAMVQTLQNRPKIREWMLKNIGLVIVDECHHIPSSQFIQALAGFKCKRVIGLTATPFRQDGWDKLITSMLGDPIYDVSIDELRDAGVLVQPDIIPVYTTFTGLEDKDLRDVSGYTYTELINNLAMNQERNMLIAHTVAQTCTHGMVVSKRVDHVEHLAQLLNPHLNVVAITGKTKNRKKILQDFKDGKIDCIVASIQLVQEGLDLPNLEQIYFATPVKGDEGGATGSTVQQAVSRVMTSNPDDPHKQAQVYFFVDYENSMLQKQWYTVRKTLKRMGIKVPSKPKLATAVAMEDLIDMLDY